MSLNFEQARVLAISCARREPGWPDKFARQEHRPDGAWVFWIDEWRRILVRPDDGKAYALYGAIGKSYSQSLNTGDYLGFPNSDERWIGSSPGRYQLFDKGIVVWDRLANRGYPRVWAAPDYSRGRHTFAAVAFFDLRNFTQWSSNNRRKPADIQEVLARIETEIQISIGQNMKIGQAGTQKEEKRRWPEFIFLKGTGDGFMIVVEMLAQNESTEIAGAFLDTCSSVTKSARKVLPSELAIGCGIDCGSLTQVFILGQWDYLGKPANNAAKLQQLAWDEICVSQEFYEQLPTPIKQSCANWRKLGERGHRYTP